MAVSQVDIEVGKRLTTLIKKLDDINSRQFAISIGIDPSQFSKIQKGAAAISLAKVVEISSKYNVNITWLIQGTGKMFLDLEQHQVAEVEENWNEKIDISLYKQDALVIKKSIEILLSGFPKSFNHHKTNSV